MVASWFIFVAIAIRIVSGAGYIRSVLQNIAKPNAITWFIWSLTAFVAFAAQLRAGAGQQAWVTFALAIGPLFICILALIRCPKASHFTFFSISCGLLALCGIILWQATSNPIMAILFSILADALGALPTLRKSYHHPETEYALPYFLSICSMAITILTITHWTFANYAFPVYILGINLALFGTIWWRGKTIKTKRRRKRRKRRPAALPVAE